MNTVVQTDASIASRIREMVESDAVQLPPLPEVAIKARDMLTSDDSSTRELSELLEQDAAILVGLPTRPRSEDSAGSTPFPQRFSASAFDRWAPSSPD